MADPLPSFPKPPPPRESAASVTLPAPRGEPPRPTRTPKAASEGHPADHEPDWLARMLASERWPSFAIRFPRLTGILLLGIAAFGLVTIERLSREGGLYLRALPAATALACAAGAWLAVTGRPTDSRGETPNWWNVGYAICLIIGSGAALALYFIVLS